MCSTCGMRARQFVVPRSLDVSFVCHEKISVPFSDLVDARLRTFLLPSLFDAPSQLALQAAAAADRVAVAAAGLCGLDDGDCAAADAAMAWRQRRSRCDEKLSMRFRRCRLLPCFIQCAWTRMPEKSVHSPLCLSTFTWFSPRFCFPVPQAFCTASTCCS